MTRAMQVIPVLDLRAGIVVQARRGQHSEYAPLRSSLVQGCEPVAVARALCAICRTRTVYVADLDAARGNPVNEAALAGLASVAATWVDAGATTPQRGAGVAGGGGAGHTGGGARARRRCAQRRRDAVDRTRGTTRALVRHVGAAVGAERRPA